MMPAHERRIYKIRTMPSKSDDDRSETPGEMVRPRTKALLADLLIKIRRGEAGYDLAVKFLNQTKDAPPLSDA